ncbi:hypothetical protein N505_0115450 [Rhodococcus aetherivorans]|nr:hypothetical protein N505_0115450 [Rhodococcus aetherivorans]
MDVSEKGDRSGVNIALEPPSASLLEVSAEHESCNRPHRSYVQLFPNGVPLVIAQAKYRIRIVEVSLSSRGDSVTQMRQVELRRREVFGPFRAQRLRCGHPMI